MSVTNLSELNKEKAPFLDSREQAKELQNQGLLAEAISASEKEVLLAMIEILKSEDFRELVLEGKVTLAMFKPDLVNTTNQDQNLTEDQRAQIFLDQIKSYGFEVMMDVSLPMDDDTVEKWYGGKPKEFQLGIPPMDENRYDQNPDNRWQEFKLLMLTRGPVTFALLYDAEGKAVEKWRELMGQSWDVNVDKKEYPESMRANYAIDNHSNVFHGSDSPESVLREIDLMIELIEKLIISPAVEKI